jgi:hypothetical protein
MKFDYSIDFKQTDFRKNPHLYRIGVGEQGVLLVEPYKSELLPHWRFKTPEIAEVSAQKIYEMFLEYLKNEDFVGADMARKFLQMGYTRSRRYANHPSGRKYKLPEATEVEAQREATQKLPYPYSSGSSNKHNGTEPQAPDAMTNEKAQSAKIFKEYWDLARTNEAYLQQKARHKAQYEQ